MFFDGISPYFHEYTLYIRNGKKYTKNRIIIFSLKMKKALVFSENIGYNILYEKRGYHFLIFIFL